MIVAGFGFRRAATSASLADALDQAREGLRADLFATVAAKCAAPCLVDLARARDTNIAAIPAETLAAQDVLSRSSASIASHGTGSVAEAAALAAAGADAQLLGPRTVSADGMATCAIAKGDRT